jgi:outer membrane protein OmpA-like peptidoglycan-associated protein
VTVLPIPSTPSYAPTSSLVPTAFHITSAQIGFLPDSATFIDPLQADMTLGPVADRVIESDLTVTVIGTTADVGSLASQYALSHARAEAVAERLVDLRVPGDRITVVGVGSNFPGAKPELDTAGVLDPTAAAQNVR